MRAVTVTEFGATPAVTGPTPRPVAACSHAGKARGMNAAPGPPPPRSADVPKQELMLTFDQLALIYKSLQAVKSLDALPAQDELFDDTIQLVDQALNDATR